MPEVLELKPLKKKHLKLIMVECEFPIDWWFEAPKEKKEDIVWNLNLISREYIALIEGLLKKYQPNFVLEERPNSWDYRANQNDPLKMLFGKFNIPFKHADISENAEAYLSAALEGHREALQKLENRIREIIEEKGSVPENDPFFQELILWKEYLKRDYDDQEDEVRYKVREAWMMMNVLNLAKTIEGKKLKGLFICDLRHFTGLEELADQLGVETEQIKIKRTIKTIEKEIEKDIEVEIE
jgi:hypothetical protein